MELSLALTCLAAQAVTVLCLCLPPPLPTRLVPGLGLSVCTTTHSLRDVGKQTTYRIVNLKPGSSIEIYMYILGFAIGKTFISRHLC